MRTFTAPTVLVIDDVGLLPLGGTQASAVFFEIVNTRYEKATPPSSPPTAACPTSEGWPDEQHQALHGLNGRLADISVISYDHLLAQALRTLELVEAPEPEVEVIVPADPDWDLEDDPL